MKRRALLVVCVAMLAATFAACGHAQHHDTELRAVMASTSASPRKFVYTEDTGATKVVVRGIIDDDFRYKARVTINNTDVLDEVTTDDAIAVRFLDPSQMNRFLRPTGGATPGAPVDASAGGATLDALRTRHWVLDDAGAMRLQPQPGEKRAVGQDPIYDALTVFRYVDQAIDQAAFTRVFNADALDYKASEDPFPKPAPKSGVTRFDLQRQRLPRAADAASGNQAAPDTKNFRKLSVYAKGGKVFRVLEDIDVTSQLDELGRIYGVKFPADKTPEENTKVAVDSLNALRTGQGLDPVRPRRMSFELVDIGKAEPIDLPPDFVKGDLSILINRGKTRIGAAGSGSGTPDAPAAPGS